ncbi:PREDICTED: patronin isoform X3 [Nicrophorus vespilloides]|uniref:Patronin isoform X3 n=1 Tax=Nicrophorus vespilloides TaxID=110193 RepID=A0ABM1MD22_NICVS|nr:PREDICTED: patronin isoform X3 [Nicrophorus vespilloides]
MVLTVATVSSLSSCYQDGVYNKSSDGIGVSLVTFYAKQRAFVKWLLSKAFNNDVPQHLREPFYKDYENQEHLKPQIVGALANADMYCQALGNIYSDPNYHNFNHVSIQQLLVRKGVFVADHNDSQYTETNLIQTNPLRMSAHMVVVESIMVLYAKEVATSDRVAAAVQRFSNGREGDHGVPEYHELSLLYWVDYANNALIKRVTEDIAEGRVTNGTDRSKSLDIPNITKWRDLCDGIGIAGLISYYCPEKLLWSKIKISALPTVPESLHNLRLVQDFCSQCLPANVFHMMPEDITYMRGSMKQILMVFLADLFNFLEIHPVDCVRYPGMERASYEGFPARNAHGVAHKRNLPPTVMTPIPDLRSGLDDIVAPQPFQVSRTPTHQPLRKTSSLQHSVSEMSEDSLRRGSEDSFVVHRGKNIPTLNSMINDEPLVPARLRANKEKMNSDTKADERGDSMAAGRPSNWNENKRTYAGRRSRRNSVSDDSQLTIENFGGSQDNLNFIGKNPDKEVGAHVGRKISAPAPPIPFVNNPAVRSTLQDARGSIQLGYDNGCEKHETERENFKLKRQLSSDDMTLRSMQERNKENMVQDVIDGEANNRMSFADVNKKDPGGIQLVYMQQDKEGFPSKSSFKTNGNAGATEKKTTTFATLPNTTTWQQQSSQQHVEHSINRSTSEDSRIGGNDHIVTSQLSDIRMKLEEKRRHIENEKRKSEMEMNRQRLKVGNAAFLQAVVKGKSGIVKSSSDAMVDSLMVGGGGSVPNSPTQVIAAAPAEPTAGPSAPKSHTSRPLTLKDEIPNTEMKWMDENQPFVENRRTPDMDNMNMDTYQQSINSVVNSSLQDMQRLASHQHQMQLAAQYYAQHNQLLQQQLVQQQLYNQPPMYNPLQSSASAPHIPQSLYQQSRLQNEPQFFLHGQQESPVPQLVAPQRRTWSQQPQPTPQPPPQIVHPPETYQQPEMRTWAKPQNPNAFILHDTSSDRYDKYHDNRYHNGGGDHSMNHSAGSASGYTLSQQHQLYGSHSNTPSTSPQHHRQHRQLSQLMEAKRSSPVSLQSMEPVRPERKSNVIHAPIPAPPADDMEPQSISFIGKDEQNTEGLSRLNITSGSRTYRIPSPTRPLITRNSFQPSPSPPLLERSASHAADISSLDNRSDPSSQKGFYISFDNDAPKRPKPPLRTKKGTASPRKERSYVEDDDPTRDREREREAMVEKRKQLERELEHERLKKELEDKRRYEKMMDRQNREATSHEMDKVNAASALVIGNDLSNPDPDLIDEREKKKERILLMSLQRRQKQEEAKANKEAETQARRDREKAKEDEKLRKKEEQAARRQLILEQHKMKKAIEEAEREGKDVDKSLLNSLKGVPKLRAKGSTARPRPKTIHIDSGSVEMAEGIGLQPSRGKKGSSSNLTANSYHSSTMKRDYYRGSQDSLASSGLLYKDSPDDSRGMSPCHSANQTLGRRSSYKTSRDPSPAQTRGRPKYSTYQNFKGRKSNSMMNLYGSSTDQDSMAYRFGDTDSGLGRATPPRRAPSPGMGPVRHLTSPSSGPGSLPVSKRRGVFDDGSSDISSTPSSILDYSGPRLYKQPATKSNRSIMHNALEYCVFPGAVNRESKQRILDCIAKSEVKHFLLLFRDAGCQFRALYSYSPDMVPERVEKLYGTGPKLVDDKMFDKFFKYNSGGKCFAQVHTKHLTVTIDAFTIHNNLWQGKKVNMPSKKDMALVI